MSEQHDTDVPWGVSPDPAASRRKVAWGNGASYDETAAPRPRIDAPAPPAAYGDFEATPLAGDDTATATATAWLHAGAPMPVSPEVTATVDPERSEPAAATEDQVGGWVPPSVGDVDEAAGRQVDLASVFDDLFDDEPSDENPELPVEPSEMDAIADVHDLPDATLEVTEPKTEPKTEPAVEPAVEPADRPDGDEEQARVDETQEPAGGPAAGEGDLPAQELLFPSRVDDSAHDPSTTPHDQGVAPDSLSDLFEDTAAGDASPQDAEEPPATSSADPHDADPETSAPRHFDLAARRAALDAARQVTAADIAAARPDQHQLRYTHSEQLYHVVDRILGLGRGGDPELQAMIRRLELTRDKDLDREQRRAYQSMLEPRLAAAQIQIASAADRDAIFDIAYDELLGIGPLGPLWREDAVNEIMVSGPFKVTVERHGRLELTPVRFRNQQHLEQTARTLAGISGDDRAVSATNPLVTVQLPRARVQFVWRPLAVAKVAIAIRKFGDLMDMGQLLSYGSLSEEMAMFLHDAVTARATLLVSGGTGSGKTTFINAVSEFIPDSERVITIEDALELQLRNTHIESLVTKEAASADDTMLFGQDQLLKASLRMRPDRIIVGEIRDGKGCSVMLEAANTGHDGTMTTVHANSPDLALQRMATLLRRVENMPDDVAKAEVGTAINVIVQVVRKRGRRFVSHISLVDAHAAVTGHGQLVTPLFTGEFHAASAAPVFGRVNGIRPDTELAIKMTDAGINPAMWE